MTPVEQIQTRYRRFAKQECRGYSDLYYTLANAVADDLELLKFLAPLPVIQPNLLLAAVQYLTGPSDMPRSPAELTALLRDRREEVAALMCARRTQTNEVGRCSAILPALPRGPLALLEVGASAGLCLLLDHFHYDYGNWQCGVQTSRVRLRCAVEGPFTLLDELPENVWRRGLDLSPVNVHDPEDVRWLLSCVWADHPERRERLAAAIALAQTHEVAVHSGDLVGDVPALLAATPRHATLIVFHSAVLAYVEPAIRTAFASLLAEASWEREIIWISNEGPSVVPEITALAPNTVSPTFLLGRTVFDQGQRTDELLALAHPHGATLTWRGST